MYKARAGMREDYRVKHSISRSADNTANAGNGANAGDGANTGNAEGAEYPIEALVELVAELAGKYTGGDSSSITYEKAQQFMEAVKYCIHECEEGAGQNWSWDSDAVSGAVMRMPEQKSGAREAYEIGYQIVLKKTARLKDIYHNLIRNFDAYGNRCLEETVTGGLPGFLQWYDARFHPQETILTLDYPVLKDLCGVTGIDAVLEYGRCIAWEQEFLRSFDREWVRRSLGAYTGDPAGMIENLCNILLPDLIGHVVLKKPLQEMGYSQEEYQILADGFAGVMKVGQEERMEHGSSKAYGSVTEGSLAEGPAAELELYLQRIIYGLSAGIFSDNAREKRAVEQYICGAIPDIAARIKHGIAFGCLDQVFRV